MQSLRPSLWLIPWIAAAAPAWADDYAPRIAGEADDVQWAIPILLSMSADGGGAVPVDRNAAELPGNVALGPRLRIGLTATSKSIIEHAKLRFEYEHDILGGVVYGRPDLSGVQLPSGGALTTIPRKASLLMSFDSGLHLLAGLTTSQGGLGLVANDGGSTWEPWGAPFADPRAGDRVLRLALAGGPTPGMGAMFTLAGDYVIADDALEPGDVAFQVAAKAEIGKLSPSNAALTVAWRHQRGDQGSALDAAILDLFGKLRHVDGDLSLELAAELAANLGQASLAPTPEHPTQTVAQLGAALKGSVRYGMVGFHLDAIVASGDSDLADGSQNAFRADSSYGFGLILFRRVLAAQSGHATATAADPSLVGQAVPGLDRFATRGAVSNAFGLFPRLSVAPIEGLEISGGPMFAFALATPMDPLNTRLAGGTPMNALDAAPGKYWGTELDGAIRYRALFGGTELVLGVEGGVLWPGSALAQKNGTSMPAVPGGRGVVQLRL
ncbi:MAG: hypothetical protein U1E65_02825 [Myxococcota bacterium]